MQQRRQQGGDWISGLERHRNRYRFKMATGGEIKTYSYGSLEEAQREHAAAVRAIARAQAEADALTWAGAVERYMAHQAERDKATERARQVTEDRLRRFFAPVLGDVLGPLDGAALYRQLRTRPGARGTPPSVQEHHHCLSRSKALVRWLVKQKLLRADFLSEVEAVGRPRAGADSKPQLNRDGLRRLVAVALDLTDRKDAGAVAALCCSVLGMRASAVASRRVQHLDDGGRVLKTEGKGRSVELSLVGETPEQESIMARLRLALQDQARGKPPEAPLIGAGHTRWWVRREVRRVCGLAGVPVVPPHGLRGTHASVGRALGISPAVLAGSLAHSEAVQVRHYATPAAIAAGQIGKVADVLGK